MVLVWANECQESRASGMIVQSVWWAFTAALRSNKEMQVWRRQRGSELISEQLTRVVQAAIATDNGDFQREMYDFFKKFQKECLLATYSASESPVKSWSQPVSSGAQDIIVRGASEVVVWASVNNDEWQDFADSFRSRKIGERLAKVLEAVEKGDNPEVKQQVYLSLKQLLSKCDRDVNRKHSSQHREWKPPDTSCAAHMSVGGNSSGVAGAIKRNKQAIDNATNRLTQQTGY
mmetsp:Transcript_16513/g.39748  ORF Transcript_16513/g.39748 Transcript_16513/m.39748 type:complete len:233 (+) Transcript_16513:1633-2331(+)